MKIEQLEAARTLFENHLLDVSTNCNVFFLHTLFVYRGLEELAFEMLEDPRLVNDWLNWENCESALKSVGLDISQDSFHVFYSGEGGFEDLEEEIENSRPEDVQTLLEYFCAHSAKIILKDWL